MYLLHFVLTDLNSSGKQSNRYYNNILDRHVLTKKKFGEYVNYVTTKVKSTKIKKLIFLVNVKKHMV
jgi:hypothetical protein